MDFTKQGGIEQTRCFIYRMCCLFSIVATDSQGAQSAALEYNILMCSGCGHNGECDYENTLEISNHAKRVVCKCQTGYTGTLVEISIYLSIYLAIYQS